MGWDEMVFCGVTSMSGSGTIEELQWDDASTRQLALQHYWKAKEKLGGV
jgi:hypothetical protein